MAKGRFLGIKLGGDASGFNKAINNSIRTVMSMTHSIRQGARGLSNYGNEANKAERDIRNFTRANKEHLRTMKKAHLLERLSGTRPDSKNNKRLQYQINRLDAISQHDRGIYALRDAQSKAIAELESNKQRMTQRMHGLGVALGGGLIAGYGSVLLGGGLLKVTGAAIKEASNLETSLAKAGAIGNFAKGSSQEQLIRKTILDVASRTKFSPAEIGKQVADLLAQGLSTTQAEQAAGPLADFMTATFGKAQNKMAKVLGVSMNKFSLPEYLKDSGEQARYLADRFITLRNVSPIDADQFEGMLASLGSAQQLGRVTVDQLMTMMALFSRAGKSGRESAQAFKSLTRINTTQAKDLVSEIEGSIGENLKTKGGARRAGLLREVFGVTLKDLKDERGQLKSTFDIMTMFLDRISKSKSPEAMKDIVTVASSLRTFQATGMDALLTLFSAKGFNNKKSGVAAIKEVLGAFQKADGASKRSADRYLATVSGITDLIRGLGQVITTLIGEPLLEVARGPLETIKTVLQQTANFLRANPEVSKMIGYIILATGAFLLIGGVLVTIVSVIGFIAIGVAEVVALVGGITMGTAALIVLLPLIAAAATALILAGSYFGKDAFDTSRLNGFITKFKSLGLVLSGLKEIFTNGMLGENVHNKLKKKGMLQYVEKTYHMWLLFKKAISKVMVDIKKSEAFQRLKHDLGSLFDTISDLMKVLSGSDLGSFKGKSVFEKMVSAISIFAKLGIYALTVMVAGVDIFLSGIVIVIALISQNINSIITSVVVLGVLLSLAALGFVVFGATIGAIVIFVGVVIVVAISLIINVVSSLVNKITDLYNQAKDKFTQVKTFFLQLFEGINIIGLGIMRFIITPISSAFNALFRREKGQSMTRKTEEEYNNKLNNALERFSNLSGNMYNTNKGGPSVKDENSSSFMHSKPIGPQPAAVGNTTQTTNKENNITFAPRLKIDTLGDTESIKNTLAPVIMELLEKSMEQYKLENREE